MYMHIHSISTCMQTALLYSNSYVHTYCCTCMIHTYINIVIVIRQQEVWLVYTHHSWGCWKCRPISKTLSMSLLPHLYSTFYSHVEHCLYFSKYNNIAIKVLCGKMLPYQPHISKAEEKRRWPKHKQLFNKLTGFNLAKAGRFEFDSIHIGWLFIAR